MTLKVLPDPLPNVTAKINKAFLKQCSIEQGIPLASHRRLSSGIGAETCRSQCVHEEYEILIAWANGDLVAPLGFHLTSSQVLLCLHMLLIINYTV